MDATLERVAATAFRHAPIAIAVVALDEPDAGRLLAVNSAMCALLGYPERELLEMRRDQLVAPGDTAPDADHWDALRHRRRHTYRLRRRLITAGGRALHVETDVALVEGEAGAGACAIASVRAIGEPAALEPTVTLGEAAQLLGVSPSTLRRWADSGRLETVRTTGGHRRFARAALREVGAPVGEGGPGLRTVGAPADPIEPLAGALGSRLGELLDATVRGLYTGPPHGWFASPAARRAAEQWAGELERAAAGGDYSPVRAATLRLLGVAERAGTTALERQLFLERVGEAAVRALDPAHLADADVAESRRLFAHLRHAALAA